MARKDQWYNRAKQQGYRTRASFKLKQLDQREGLFGPGNTVVDLGAAPGGWIQVAAEEVGAEGKVIGVDFQRIKGFGDEYEAEIETIKGDMTEEKTKERVREAAGGEVDVVLSDMAPNMTGEYNLDHARSVYLARQAFETALDVLDTGGDFAVKVFQGPDVDDLRTDMEEEFQYVRTTTPKASRDESSETYLIAKHRLTAPVREGDVLEVTIEDIGSEGDGIAKVEGYTLFVDGVEQGQTLDIEVTGLKPRFGFAKPAEES
ncbi:23S rRNA (uridine(2552)-2'-O)-methyltransferase [Haloarchaeobius amylolyticus]|uniref:23S rRNA (uridine(2552)-2'-O)-methyltransferase n=1 Tax=Haloarchaeobius amylolyticus TaxID=1198296 RepID=UPI0022714901|nr:23S rRNA (uridine(2552)-2'-O)-methyltransferase [Haloarchaeobius amylolyticus]